VTPAVTLRTRILLALAALAPASILIARLGVAAAIRQAREHGPADAWVDPGLLPHLLLFVGLGSLVAGIVSLVIDVRRPR